MESLTPRTVTGCAKPAAPCTPARTQGTLGSHFWVLPEGQDARYCGFVYSVPFPVKAGSLGMGSVKPAVSRPLGRTQRWLRGAWGSHSPTWYSALGMCPSGSAQIIPLLYCYSFEWEVWQLFACGNKSLGAISLGFQSSFKIQNTALLKISFWPGIEPIESKMCSWFNYFSLFATLKKMLCPLQYTWAPIRSRERRLVLSCCMPAMLMISRFFKSLFRHFSEPCKRKGGEISAIISRWGADGFQNFWFGALQNIGFKLRKRQNIKCHDCKMANKTAGNKS